MAVAKQLPEGGDMNAEIAVIDEGRGPCDRHELALRHNLATPLHECNQEVEGSATEPNGLAILKQNLLAPEQLKCPKV